MPSQEIAFNIAHWHAVSEQLSSAESWQQWAIRPEILDSLPQRMPDISFLSALHRRRLSKSARLLFSAAWPLMTAESGCPVVFASYDGEINRSFDLWQMLLRDQQVSPTSFSLSVHNALIGQWGMLRHDMNESTALCVSTDGFETAFVEAAALLQEGCEQVLVLVADDPLSNQYAIGNILRAPFAYAFAALIQPGEHYRLKLCRSEQKPATLAYYGALNWIKQVSLLKQQQILSFIQNYDTRTWQWQYQS